MTICVEMVQKRRLQQGFRQNRARTSYLWSPCQAALVSAHRIESCEHSPTSHRRALHGACFWGLKNKHFWLRGCGPSLYIRIIHHTFFSHLVWVITQVLRMWRGFVAWWDIVFAGIPRFSRRRESRLAGRSHDRNCPFYSDEIFHRLHGAKFVGVSGVPWLLFTKGPWSLFFDQFFHHGFHAWPINILYIFLHGISTKAQWIWR